LIWSYDHYTAFVLDRMLRIKVNYIFSWYIWLVGPRLNLRLTDRPWFISCYESTKRLLICYGVTQTIHNSHNNRISGLCRRRINYAIYTESKSILSVNLA
jgi:hypothetical protein